MSITRHHVGPRMSQAVEHGDTVYLAGQVADDASLDVAGQTQQILDKIDSLLAECGSDKSKVATSPRRRRVQGGRKSETCISLGVLRF